MTHQLRETRRKIKVEVKSCSLQLPKYNSSSDSKGPPGRARSGLFVSKKPKLAHALFSFARCNIVLLEVVGLPTCRSSQSSQPGNWAKAKPATGDLSVEVFLHGIKQLW